MALNSSATDVFACKFNKIPNEIMLEIMKHLKDEDALTLGFTCRRMLDLIVEQERKLILRWNKNHLLEELIRWKETMNAVTEIYYYDNEYCDTVEMIAYYGSSKCRQFFPSIANTYQRKVIDTKGIAIELFNLIQNKDRRTQTDFHKSKPNFYDHYDSDKISSVRKSWIRHRYVRPNQPKPSEDRIFRGLDDSGIFNSCFASDEQIKYVIKAFPCVKDITLVQKKWRRRYL